MSLIPASKTFDIHIFPPTVNHYWLQGRNHRRYLSKEGRRFKEVVGFILNPLRPIDNKIVLTIAVRYPDKRRRDLDNLLKPILDSLQGYIYKDDSQVIDLRIYRDDAIKGFLKITYGVDDGSS